MHKFICILQDAVEILTIYKQYLVVCIKIIHKLLGLWIKWTQSLKSSGSFAMMVILFDVNSCVSPQYYQQAVDKVVNNFNLSIFLCFFASGFWG